MGLLTVARLTLLTLAIATSLSHGTLVSQTVPTIVDPNLLGAVTQTTATIQAPLCSALVVAITQPTTNARIFVVATASLANISNELIPTTPMTNWKKMTYTISNAGAKGWYVAMGGLPIPSCVNPPPSLTDPTSYYRVGASTQCSSDITCKNSLLAGTMYWFKFVVADVDASGDIQTVYLESSWSQPILLRNVGDVKSIGVTPGPRSGGMVVVTVVLVVLLFVVLIATGLLLILSRFMKPDEPDVEKSPMKTKEPSKAPKYRDNYSDEVDGSGHRNAGFSPEVTPVKVPTQPLQMAPPVSRPPPVEDYDDDEMEVATPTDSGLDTFSPGDNFRMQVLQTSNTSDTAAQDIDEQNCYASDINQA